MQEKYFLRQTKTEGLYNQQICLSRNFKRRSSERRKMIQVRNSDIHEERKSIRWANKWASPTPHILVPSPHLDPQACAEGHRHGACDSVGLKKKIKKTCFHAPQLQTLHLKTRNGHNKFSQQADGRAKSTPNTWAKFGNKKQKHDEHYLPFSFTEVGNVPYCVLCNRIMPYNI